MQAIKYTVRHISSVARPADGSALRAGNVVTVTVPLLTMGDGLLAIGQQWSELILEHEEPTASHDDSWHAGFLATLADPA